jgi:hypothetical protein
MSRNLYKNMMEQAVPSANLIQKTKENMATAIETKVTVLHGETLSNQHRRLPLRKVVAFAAVLVLMLGLAMTGYAIVSRFADRADAGLIYEFTTSDEYIFAKPNEVGAGSSDERYDTHKNLSYESAAAMLGRDFKIPNVLGLSVSNIEYLDGQTIDHKFVSIDMKNENGWIVFSVEKSRGDDTLPITVGIPGMIEEIEIKGVTVYRVSRDADENISYRFGSYIWQYNGLSYSLFWIDKGGFSDQDYELMIASVLP